MKQKHINTGASNVKFTQASQRLDLEGTLENRRAISSLSCVEEKIETLKHHDCPHFQCKVTLPYSMCGCFYLVAEF